MHHFFKQVWKKRTDNVSNLVLPVRNYRITYHVYGKFLIERPIPLKTWWFTKSINDNWIQWAQYKQEISLIRKSLQFLLDVQFYVQFSKRTTTRPMIYIPWLQISCYRNRQANCKQEEQNGKRTMRSDSEN